MRSITFLLTTARLASLLTHKPRSYVMRLVVNGRPTPLFAVIQLPHGYHKRELEQSTVPNDMVDALTIEQLTEIRVAQKALIRDFDERIRSREGRS